MLVLFSFIILLWFYWVCWWLLLWVVFCLYIWFENLFVDFFRYLVCCKWVVVEYVDVGLCSVCVWVVYWVWYCFVWLFFWRIVFLVCVWWKFCVDLLVICWVYFVMFWVIVCECRVFWGWYCVLVVLDLGDICCLFCCWCWVDWLVVVFFFCENDWWCGCVWYGIVMCLFVWLVWEVDRFVWICEVYFVECFWYCLGCGFGVEWNFLVLFVYVLLL